MFDNDSARQLGVATEPYWLRVRRTGDLSTYALACGYVQTRVAKDGAEIRLGCENGVYRVTTRSDVMNDIPRYFRTISAARRYFKRIHNLTHKGV